MRKSEPPAQPAPDGRQKLIAAGSDLFRKKGYVGTSVDDICAAVGVTKGAFFHHFTSKETLAQACLEDFGCRTSARVAAAPFLQETDPVKRAVGFMDFFIATLSNTNMVKSCLAGTLVQEISETNPALRAAAQQVFAHGTGRFKQLLDEACRASKNKLDTDSLSKLWLVTMQGSLILYKAGRDEKVIAASMNHVRTYIVGLLGIKE